MQIKRRTKNPNPTWWIAFSSNATMRDIWTIEKHICTYRTSAIQQSRQITSGAFDESAPAWSPDGKLIAFVSNRTDNPDGNSNTDIWIVGADNTDKGQTLIQVTDNPGADHSPAWSPDGSMLAHATVTEPENIWYATTHLATTPIDGGKTKVLTQSLDRHVSSIRFGKDANSILFTMADSAERPLVSYDLRTGSIKRLISGQQTVRSYSTNRRGRHRDPPEQPATSQVRYFVRQGADFKQITKVNTDLVKSLDLAEVEHIQFKSADGTPIEGFLFYPPGYDARLRYPTILRIHGGPVSQYDHRFNFEAQLFAANGYVVVTTNPRGSSGYGQEFSRAIWADWGNKDYQDVNGRDRSCN